MNEAISHSVETNRIFGIRRTNAEKRKAVETFLKDEQWSQWSNREIARRCGVSEAMVRRSRISIKGQSRKFITGHGSIAEMRVDNIGKTRLRKEKSAEPDVSVRFLKVAGKIVSEKGRDYAEVLIASLKYYLEMTQKNPSRLIDSNYEPFSLLQEVDSDATVDCTSGS